MTERLIVRVDASPDHPNTLRVQDAFEHIIDLFDLTGASGDNQEGDIIWRLVSVSMSSPLTVVAEAVSARAGVNIDAAARVQKQNFVRNWASLRGGRLPAAWSSGRAHKVAKSFVVRQRQIGTTQIVIEERKTAAGKDEQIEITRADADASIISVESATFAEPLIKPKEQIGSVEGVFLQVATHYHKPAILIKERKTGSQLWCMISEDHQREIARGANFDDVWNGRRIVVSGRIAYDNLGRIFKVSATHIRLITGGEIELRSIKDKDFTGGLASAEYLERLREGQLG